MWQTLTTMTLLVLTAVDVMFSSWFIFMSVTRIVPKNSSEESSLSTENMHRTGTGWWHGVVGNAFRLKRSYCTPGSVSTAMGDCLRAG